MAYDEQLVKRIRAALKGSRGAGERYMFGGVCFTIDGNMVCGVVRNELMVRVGPDNYEAALKQSHSRPMDFTGRPMKGYVFVAEQGVKRASSLKMWVEAGVAHVRTLPPKPPKRKGN